MWPYRNHSRSFDFDTDFDTLRYSIQVATQWRNAHFMSGTLPNSYQNMLLSIIVRLHPQQDVTLPAHLGRANYAETLRHLAQVESGLDDWVHDSPSLKPITCSSLFGDFPRKGNQAFVKKEEDVWVRLTSLNERSSQGLQKALLSGTLSTWQLAHHQFKVVEICTAPQSHRWAGQTTYAELGREASSKPSSKPLRFDFELFSPTAFKSNEMQMPIPLPSLFFQSLLNRWNAFSPTQLPDELLSFVEAHVAIGKFEIKSMVVPQKNRGIRTGAVGRISYVVRNKDRYWTGILAQLAEFARYSGVGVQTTTGMGQVICSR